MAHVEPDDAREDQIERCPVCRRRHTGYCDPTDLYEEQPEDAADIAADGELDFDGETW